MRTPQQGLTRPWRKLPRTGRRGLAISADFADPVPAAQSVMEGAIKAFGRVDVLVKSAAIFGSGSLASLSESDWDRHFAINLKAPCFSVPRVRRPALRRPIRAASLTSSTGEPCARPGNLAYTLTKAALVTMTEILAQELARRSGSTPSLRRHLAASRSRRRLSRASGAEHPAPPHGQRGRRDFGGALSRAVRLHHRRGSLRHGGRTPFLTRPAPFI